jgi:hypothetical protein
MKCTNTTAALLLLLGTTTPACAQTQAANHAQPADSPQGRISDARCTASFGSGHTFHVSQSEHEHRRFPYSGLLFGFIDPWPVGWGYGDNVWVMFVDGGYYMCDLIHPRVRISIDAL